MKTNKDYFIRPRLPGKVLEKMKPDWAQKGKRQKNSLQVNRLHKGKKAQDSRWSAKKYKVGFWFLVFNNKAISDATALS